MGIYAEQDTLTYLDGQAKEAQVPATPFDKDESHAGQTFRQLYLARRGYRSNGAGSTQEVSATNLTEISQQRTAAMAAAEAERRQLLNWPEIRELLGWTCAADVVTTAEGAADTTGVTSAEPAKTESANGTVVARYPYGVLYRGGL